jgi:hypothetical protein
MPKATNDTCAVICMPCPSYQKQPMLLCAQLCRITTGAGGLGRGLTTRAALELSSTRSRQCVDTPMRCGVEVRLTREANLHEIRCMHWTWLQLECHMYRPLQLCTTFAPVCLSAEDVRALAKPPQYLVSLQASPPPRLPLWSSPLPPQRQSPPQLCRWRHHRVMQPLLLPRSPRPHQSPPQSAAGRVRAWHGTSAPSCGPPFSSTPVMTPARLASTHTRWAEHSSLPLLVRKAAGAEHSEHVISIMRVYNCA